MFWEGRFAPLESQQNFSLPAASTPGVQNSGLCCHKLQRVDRKSMLDTSSHEAMALVQSSAFCWSSRLAVFLPS
jgi:hypothetical protein